MAGVMPSLSEPISPTLGGDYLRAMAAGDLAATEQMRKYRGDQMKNYTDLSKTMLSNADDLSSVFGGTQIAPMLEGVLGSDVWGTDTQGNTLHPLTEGALSGPFTGQMEGLMLEQARADIAAKNRSGRGGGGGSSGGGGSALYYKDPATGQIHGVSSAAAAGPFATQGYIPYSPVPGDNIIVHGKNDSHNFVYGGDAGGGGGNMGGGGPDPDDIAPGTSADEVRDSVSAAHPAAVVVGGKVFLDPDQYRSGNAFYDENE